MGQVNKISSFKSFTEVKNQEATMKLREENNAKRQKTVNKIGEILDEMGLTSLSELDEVKKQALINKMFGNVSEDEAEDIEDKLNKLGEPKKLEEGNAFGDAVRKAKEAGEDEFEFDGKTYKVKESLVTEDSKINYVTITNDLFDADSNWWVKNKLKVSNEISKALSGCKIKHVIIDIDKVHESLINEGKHGMAKKLLKGIIDGDSTEAEGIKLSKDLADHYLNWINTSPYGKKNENLPLYMLINASFNWGIERGLDPKLKKELADLKVSQAKNESVINEARSISKIQYDWSKLTTQMQATAQNWKAAEGAAKESLLGKLKEMTAQKKALEAELDAAIADKDKDLELVVTEAYLNEAQYFKSTKNFIDFLEEIDGMPEHRIKRIMGKDYIDTPGGFRDEADDYDNDIEEYTRSNMGNKDFEALRTWWENNVQESQVNEADMTKFYDGFIVFDQKNQKTYKFKYVKGTSNVKVENDAIDKLMKATHQSRANFGVRGFIKKGQWNSDETEVFESVVNEGSAKQFDVDFNNMVRNIKSGYGWIDPEYVADTWENSSDSIDFELVKGEIYKRLIAAKLLAFADDEDEEAAGQFVKSLKELGIKESVVNEAEIKSDAEFKEYAMAVLKKAFGDEFDEAKATEVVDGILKKCDGDYGACVGMLTSSLGESVVTEAFDADYWEDYHEDASKIKNPSGMQIQQEVEAAVEEWNDNNENGKENEVTSAGEKKVLKLAKEFVKAKGWICHDIIDAMIAQES